MIPAQRIKQLRAILLKSRRSLASRFKTQSYGSLHIPAGKGQLAAHAAIRTRIARKIKAFRAGEDVPIPRSVMNDTRKPDIKEPVYYGESIKHPGYRQDHKRARAIIGVETLANMSRRKGSRKTMLRMRKLLKQDNDE